MPALTDVASKVWVGVLHWSPLQLVELSVGMSGAMGLVYDAIAELMDACVKELRKSNKLDTTDLTLDQVGRVSLPSQLVGPNACDLL